MTKNEEQTTVYLSPEDAIMFVEFQKRFALMKLLHSIGAFDIRSGSVTIHFDNLGGIGSVDKYEHFKAPANLQN